MSETFAGGASGAILHGHKAGALGAADLLCLAAAPAFAFMSLLTGVLGGGQMATMCGAPQAGSLLSGMVPMYVLMSLVHAAPWLKLIARRRSGAAGPDPVPLASRRIQGPPISLVALDSGFPPE